MSSDGSVGSQDETEADAWHALENIETIFQGKESREWSHVHICPNVDLVAVADKQQVRLLVSLLGESFLGIICHFASVCRGY